MIDLKAQIAKTLMYNSHFLTFKPTSLMLELIPNLVVQKKLYSLCVPFSHFHLQKAKKEGTKLTLALHFIGLI